MTIIVEFDNTVAAVSGAEVTEPETSRAEPGDCPQTHAALVATWSRDPSDGRLRMSWSA